MVHTCSVLGCKNIRDDRSRKVDRTFHKFPSDPACLKNWLTLLDRPEKGGKPWSPADHSRICSDHFHPDDFIHTSQLKRLKKNAIPIHLPPRCKMSVHLKKDKEGGCGEKKKGHLSVKQGAMMEVRRDPEESDLTLHRPYTESEVKKLMEEYLKMAKSFQQLKQLARINLEVLYLYTHFVNTPEVKGELDKVEKLVQFLMHQTEVLNLDLVGSNNQTGENCINVTGENVANHIPSTAKSGSDNSLRGVTESSSLNEPSIPSGSTFTGQNFVNTSTMPVTQSYNKSFPVISPPIKDATSQDHHSHLTRTDQDVVIKKEVISEDDEDDDDDNPKQTALEDDPQACPVCGKILKHKDSLRKHMTRHKNKNEWGERIEYEDDPQTCTLCGKVLKHRESFRKHMALHKKKEEKGQLLESRIQQAMASVSTAQSASDPEVDPSCTGNNDERMQCKICNKRFDTRRRLHKHMILHRAERPCMCHICGKPFTGRKNLINHLRGAHSKAKQEVCGVCGKTFSHRGNLRRHLILHRGDRPFKCTLCDKTFNSAHSRADHVQKHTGNYPYRCSYCNKGINTPSYLRIHERNHTGEKPFKCSVCGKAFISDYGRKSHQRSFHPDGTDTATGALDNSQEEKVYNCTLCQMKFCYDVSLALHMLRHKEELTQCYLCNDEMFSCANELKSHIHGVHLKEKSFKCKHCDEVFYTQSLRNRHQQSHHSEALADSNYPITPTTKYKCEICAKEFSLKSNLKRHSLTHSGVKPHQCKVCEIRFSTIDGLRLHWWTHTDKKRYNCQYCDQGFNDRRVLLNHTTKVHQIDNQTG